MTVYDLKQHQLDELKTRVFYLNESDSMYDSLMESWDNEIEMEHEKAQYFADISNKTIYKLFSGYDFVEEDFGSDLTIDDLPTAEIFELELFDPYESDDELEELILDFLSNKYGFCVNTFNYKINENATHVIITDIDWDTAE